MTVNGVILPDIPEGVLESFPYAFIALLQGTAEGVAVYELWASENETIQCNGHLLWLAATEEEYGYRGYYYQVGDSTDWIPNGASDSGTESTLWLASGNYSIAWSNHDIWTVTAQDETTGELTYGDLYFAKTGEEISAVRYSIAGSILDDIANQVQRLTEKTNQIKPTEMADMLEGVTKGFPNGTKWTYDHDVMIYTKGSAREIAFGNGVFVMCDYMAGRIYYSTSGKSWDVATKYANSALAVHYADGKFVCAYGQGTGYSTDGRNWKWGNFTAEMLCVHYGNGMWVAGGTKCVYYSQDGVTWTKSETTFTSDSSIKILCYGGGVWVGATNNNGLYYSTDNGKTWSAAKSTSGNFTKISYGNGLWRVSCGSDRSYYSTNGIEWTRESTDTGSVICGAHYDNGVWVACKYSVTWSPSYSEECVMVYSEDGLQWTESDNAYEGSPYVTLVHYANGVWIFDEAYSTDNGRTWHDCPGFPSSCKGIAYGNGIWVANECLIEDYAQAYYMYYSVGWEPT